MAGAGLDMARVTGRIESLWIGDTDLSKTPCLCCGGLLETVVDLDCLVRETLCWPCYEASLPNAPQWAVEMHNEVHRSKWVTVPDAPRGSGFDCQGTIRFTMKKGEHGEA